MATDTLGRYVRRFNDIQGLRFNRWAVLRFAYFRRVGSGSRAFWTCRCDCGIIRDVCSNNLLSGFTKSCGCLKREVTKQISTTHGYSRIPEFHIWKLMNARCQNPKALHYDCYGGRGIKVVWDSFEEFFRDMGKRPTAKHTLERKDNDGHYSADNCVWATRKEQSNNTRRNRFLTHQGKTLTVTQWAEVLDVPPTRISSRLAYGWSVEKTLTTPLLIDRKRVTTEFPVKNT